MPSKSHRVPTYRLHRASGNAIVTLNGKDHYLGRFGTPESRAKYDRTVADWIARGRRAEVPGGTGSVNALVLAYVAHAETYYVKGGLPTSRLALVRSVGRAMTTRFGLDATASVSVADMLSLRRSWVDRGNARSSCNLKFRAAVEFFRWGVEAGIVPPGVWHGFRSIRGLARGRCEAIEAGPVGTVDRARVDAVLGLLDDDVRDLIAVQEWTGMRPGEATGMRAGEVDRAAGTWVYRPGSHKTEHRGRLRAIAIGPKARAVLGPRIDRAAAGALVFPPGPIRLPLMPGPPARPADALVRGYREAIGRACDAAGVPRWTPNQLRHNAATAVRRAFGIEHASVVLGHSKVSTTEIYAEKNIDMAAKIMEEMG